LDIFSQLLTVNGPKSGNFLEIYPNVAQRAIWIGHPFFKNMAFDNPTVIDDSYNMISDQNSLSI
jgi:hypothetical protein